MSLINLLLKTVILILDLRDTYDALDSVKLDEIGHEERKVTVRNAEQGTRQTVARRRVGTSKRKAAVKSALTTAFIWNLFHKVEPLCDRTVAWFVPFYDSFKTLFLIWMLFTRSYGAGILLYRFLTPILRPYEPIIDSLIGLALGLSTWVLVLLGPVIERCRSVAQERVATTSSSEQANEVPFNLPATSSHDRKGLSSRPILKSFAAEKTKKKPSPPPPPASVSNRDTAASVQQPRLGTVRSRQVPAKKVPQSNLAATRRVLQELPVPSHAFAPNLASASASSAPLAPKGHGTPPAPVSSTNGHMNNSPAVKVEPSTPSAATASLSAPAVQTTASASSPRPPPTPPTGLSNYAFIPGMTPQGSGPSSVVSPTPRFPGGFAFSLARHQASTSTSANPLQVQSRVPATTQMAPLSLSAQAQSPPNHLGLLGLNGGNPNSTATHESVDSAHDDRIVPPPNSAATLRKASSSRSLKGKAASAVQTVSRGLASSGSKKRARPDEADGAVEDAAGTLRPSTAKRARPATSKAANGRTAGAKIPSSSKVETKGTSVDSRDSTAVDKSALRRTAAENGVQRGTKKPAASGASLGDDEGPVSDAAAEKTKVKASSSPRKGAAKSAKQKAPRTTIKKASNAGKGTINDSAEAAQPSEPLQRLTRSRTKPNLAG